ncbi:MAG: 16S rRNA (cytosine(967)-C(5))-methyltransferase RsmB [Bacillota bacterium]|jgi:16S rRNA (cytosine967-C5)-methyltransferase|nr:16S rRNA (cytosine(967)-C(5))-methyltransferase RsmB [Bacillota bacterium]NLL27078.1 16S rRNA (cytosine(967)-C(5))-methyltransferase RsmB [Erysipelotrichia bacterium]
MSEREVAFNCLCKITIDKKFSNIVLKNCQDNSPLVTQLVYGTLRNYRLVRTVWSKYVSKFPPAKICQLLDMATYELLLLDKPEYATVNEIVNIAKKIKGGNYASFVNAVLRKISKDDINNHSLAVRTSHPDWLVDLWTVHYGKDICEKICFDNLKDGKVALRVNNLLTDEKQLLKDKRFYRGFVEGCLYFQGNIIDTDYFKNNQVIIQSESSQLAVKEIGVQEDQIILDLCAAPGSKTVQLAIDLNKTGLVVSNDIYDFRVDLIKQNVKRYELTNVVTSCCDGTKINEKYQENSFDVVLLDAPCSGLGTLKHKPEIKITIAPEDLDNLVDLQRELLKTAALMIKDNGVLLYSTCTLNKKENEKQIEWFLKENTNYFLESEKTIFPFDYDSDGFYIAKLIKKAN